jgi:PilZ domain
MQSSPHIWNRKMGPNAEKRSLNRFNHESLVMLQQPDKGLYVYGTMHNFSGKGMYLEADFVCQPGTKILIQITRPPAKSMQKVISGEVRWFRHLFEDESSYEYGLGVRLW